MRLIPSTRAPRLMRNTPAMALTLACLVAASRPGAAIQLDDTTCSNLRGTRDALVSLGVKADMQKGPRWAAENLAEDRISRIKQYLVAMEKVLFQCTNMPRGVREGMEYAMNMPDPKPYHDRRTFPLPVRKPPASPELRPSTLE